MDADSFPPISPLSLCPHRAPARRRPARVVRHRGTGRAAAGRAGSFNSAKNVNVLSGIERTGPPGWRPARSAHARHVHVGRTASGCVATDRELGDRRGERIEESCELLAGSLEAGCQRHGRACRQPCACDRRARPAPLGGGGTEKNAKHVTRGQVHKRGITGM